MTPAIPPIPGTGPQPSPNALFDEPSAAPQQTNPQDVVRNVLQQIQSLDEQAGDIARQFPEFAPFAKDIKDALKAGMLKIVGGNQQGMEAPSLGIAV